MPGQKADIIAQLQNRILSLQGYKLSTPGNNLQIDLGPINQAFPKNCFPFGAVHEFIVKGTENASTTSGFVAAILSSFMKSGRVSVWISSSRTIFPPALKIFNLEPDHIIFIDLQDHKDVLWVIEETLKCDGLAAVVAEIQQINFKESRRLQLAVEQSGVTGFILRSRSMNTIASVSRWKISSLPSEMDDGMPGVGFPRWNVELLKIRNGKPGAWQMEWSNGRFNYISPQSILSIPQEQKRKTG